MQCSVFPRARDIAKTLGTNFQGTYDWKQECWESNQHPKRIPHIHFEQLCAPHTTLQLVLLPCSYRKISCKPARTPIPGKNNPVTATNPRQIFKISASFPSLVPHTATETDSKTKGLDLRVERKKPKLALELAFQTAALGGLKKLGRNWIFSFLFFFSLLLFQP